MLGSINLSEFVIDPFTDGASFDYDSFTYTVEQSVIALNEVLDEGLPLHPLQIQRDTVKAWRQIGLGVMAIGDMLIKLGIKYGSKRSLFICKHIGEVMADTAISTSALLAKQDGTYPKYNKKAILSSPYFIANTSSETKECVQNYGLRNSQLLTIAPTGTLSTMLGITGGIEPVYMNSFFRKTISLHDKEVTYKVYTPIVEQYMKANNIKNEEDLPKYFVTAMDLNFKDRIDMQSTWQQHIDASISSTVNVANEFTVEQVEELYMYAWEKGLKGITIFRSGCARNAILTSTDKTETTELKRGEWKPKADDTIYYERKLIIGCGKLMLFIGWSNSEKEIQDFFVIRSGKNGCEKSIQTSVISMSGMLRLGGKLSNIEKAFEGVGNCNSFVGKRVKGIKLSKGTSCGTAILNEIKLFQSEMGNGEVKVIPIKSIPTIKPEEPKNNLCPICKAELRFEGGCNSCPDCGFSHCS